jgi:hypothetical protein
VHTKLGRLTAVTTMAVALAGVAGCHYTGFADGNAKNAAGAGTTFVKSKQLADGSFETSGFPGFETPDAVLAIAENAQQQVGWSVPQAKAAVDATVKNGNSVLHAIDDYSQSGLNAGQAAKLTVLVARPLGLSVTAFDPDGDGAVNLQALIDSGHQAGGSYGAFNATLYAAIAKRPLGGVPADTVALIRGAQRADGGWNFLGESGGTTASDVDTTALAIQALVASHIAVDDTDVRQGLAFLAAQQRANGAWQSFGADDPNSTAVAMIAITAAGFDPTVSCWRDTVAPARQGTPYGSPATWLRADQAADGHFESPNDDFGVNTFATSQAIQALRRGWQPVEFLPAQTCPAP